VINYISYNRQQVSLKKLILSHRYRRQLWFCGMGVQHSRYQRWR